MEPLTAAELLEENFLESLSQLALILKKRKDLQRGGSLLSMRVGQTREFKDYRAYVPKDDLRSIDWRLYARLGKLFVRLFEDQQQAQVHLYLDCSASMATPYREKWKSTARLTLALAYLSWQSHHRVSVHGFGTTFKTLVTGLGMAEGFKSLLATLVQLVPSEVGDLPKAMEQRVVVRGSKSFHVVLSDFLMPEPSGVTRMLNSLHRWGGETQLLQVLHPEERTGNLGGVFDLEDVETKQLHRMSGTKLLSLYQENFQRHQSQLQDGCRRFGMGFYSADGTQNFDHLFRDFLVRSTYVGKAS